MTARKQKKAKRGAASKKPAARKAGAKPASKKALDLTALRARIDGIDSEVLTLLSERARLAQEVGRVKNGAGAPVHVPERERVILERLLGENPGPLSKKALEAIYREIFSACLSLERQLHVTFLGPETTYSHQAALQHFGRQCALEPAASIDEVFDAVERGRVDYGVVPVENSTEGSVNLTLDRLVETTALICAEIVVDIHHNFLRSPRANGRPVERLYSHPQVFAQCHGWIREHEPQAELVAAASTAAAAAQAAKDEKGAALASLLAAEAHGLEVLAKNTEDRSENRTRFLVMGRQETSPSGNDKTSFVASVKDMPGVLFHILAPFAKNRVSLTRIESRPVRGKAWEYVFLIDVAAHMAEKGLQKAVAQMERDCRQVKVLGSYPRAF